MKKHRAFWREVRKRAFAWLLVCLLVVGIVKPLEYGHATSNGEPQNETMSDLDGTGTEGIADGLLEEKEEGDASIPEISTPESEAEANSSGMEGEQDGFGGTMQNGPAKIAPAPEEIDLSGYDWSTVDVANESDPKILAVLEYMESIQAMIDALPDTSLITKANSLEIFEAFIAVMDAMDLMEDEVGINYFVVISQNDSLVNDAHLWEVESKLSQVMSGEDVLGGASLYAADLPASASGRAQLYKTDGSLVPDGYEIASLSDGFKIRFEWTDTEFNAASITAGTPYYLTMPNHINVDLTGLDGHPIYFTEGDANSGLFATLETEGDKITVKFTAAGIASGGTINFDCNIHAGKGDVKEDGTLPLNIGGATINVKVDSLKATEKPSITKGDTNSGKVKADGTIEWKVTYNPGDPNWTASNRPNVIQDTLPDGMVYVAGSASVSPGENVTVDTAALPVLQFNFANDEAAKVARTITYKTRLNEDQIAKIMSSSDSPSSSYENKVNIYNGTTKLLPEDVKHTVAPPDNRNNPFSKSFSSVRYEGTDYVATWTTVVNGYGIDASNLDYLTVTDTIPSTSTYLSDISNIKVGGKAISEGTDLSISTEKDKFTLHLGNLIKAGTVSPNDNGQYVITYETKLDAAAFSADEATVTANTRNETTVDLKLSTVASPVTNNANAIIPKNNVSNVIIEKNPGTSKTLHADKDGMVYDFEIVVNKNKLLVTGGTVTITDVLPDNIVPDGVIPGVSGHKLDCHIVSAKVVENTGSATIGTFQYYTDGSKATLTTADADNCMAFDVEISDISFKTVKIKVEVKVQDKLLFSLDNVNYDFINTVNAKNGSIDQSDDAARRVSRTQANHKILDSYDAATQEITWRIAVNQDSNAIALGEMEVEDIIPEGLSYVPGSGILRVNGADKGGIGEEDGTYATKDAELISSTENADNTTTVKWKLNVKEPYRYDILYKTKVDYEGFYDKTSNTEFTNTVNITKQVGPDKVVNTRTAKLTLPPTGVVDKRGRIDGNSNRVIYEVGINPLKQKINTGSNGIVLEDTLGSNLFFLENSVEIYKANLSTGSIKDKENANLGAYTYTKVGSKIDAVSVTYDLGTNSFKIVTPQLEDETTYLVVYTCLATSPGNLENSVKLSGVQNAVADKTDFSNVMFRVSASGFSFYNPPTDLYATLEVRKVDKNNNPIVKNDGAGNPDNTIAAKFDIYDAPTGGKKLAGSIFANDKGLFIINKANLSGLDSVWLEETNPPEGYMALTERIEVSVKDLNKGITVKNYINEADKTNLTDLKVKKADQDDLYQTAFDNAKFALYSDENCTVQVGSEMAMDSAGITFTGLTEGNIYYLKETDTPSGYITSDVIKVLAGTNTEITVINYQKIKLTIKKEDPSGNFVPGAKVTVYKNEDKTIIAKGDIGAGEILLQDIEIPTGGLEISLGVGTYWIEESNVPDNYIGAEVKKIELTADTTETIINTPNTIPDPPKGGGDDPDDSSSSETTAPPPAKAAEKTDANGNKVGLDGKIPQTGQLWWPVWLMGGLGSLFLILGFLWKPKKKK